MSDAKLKELLTEAAKRGRNMYATTIEEIGDMLANSKEALALLSAVREETIKSVSAVVNDLQNEIDRLNSDRDGMHATGYQEGLEAAAKVVADLLAEASKFGGSSTVRAGRVEWALRQIEALTPKPLAATRPTPDDGGEEDELDSTDAAEYGTSTPQPVSINACDMLDSGGPCACGAWHEKPVSDAAGGFKCPSCGSTGKHLDQQRSNLKMCFACQHVCTDHECGLAHLASVPPATEPQPPDRRDAKGEAAAFISGWKAAVKRENERAAPPASAAPEQCYKCCRIPCACNPSPSPADRDTLLMEAVYEAKLDAAEACLEIVRQAVERRDDHPNSKTNAFRQIRVNVKKYFDGHTPQILAKLNHVQKQLAESSDAMGRLNQMMDTADELIKICQSPLNSHERVGSLTHWQPFVKLRSALANARKGGV